MRHPLRHQRVAAPPPTLSGITETLIAATDDGGLRLQDFLQVLGSRGLGAMLIPPSLIILLPSGLVPGVPGIAALTMILIAGHMVLNRDRLWLPHRLARMPLPAEPLAAGLRRFHPLARRMDRWTESRFAWFAASRFAIDTVAAVTVVLSLMILIVGFIPGIPAAFSLAILVFAVGLAVQNGLLILCGHAITILAAVAIFWLLR